MNTTGKCLRFFYYIQGDDHDKNSFIRVSVENEDFSRSELGRYVKLVTELRLIKWRVGYVSLPNGTHRIAITGVRGEEAGSLGLDDVEVHFCWHFKGVLNNSESGKLNFANYDQSAIAWNSWNGVHGEHKPSGNWSAMCAVAVKLCFPSD
jgi:hypothetical protein